MKGPDECPFTAGSPHQQGVLATNERMKGKVESHQYCGLFEGATTQKYCFRTRLGRKTVGMHWFRQVESS